MVSREDSFDEVRKNEDWFSAFRYDGSILTDPYTTAQREGAHALCLQSLFPTYTHLTGRQRLSGINKPLRLHV